eukprot:327055-Chlamydomonas_euryale.AAC.1
MPRLQPPGPPPPRQGFMEVWGEGATFAELQAAVQAAPASLTAQWLSPERSFKVAVEGYGHKVSDARRIELIHQLGFVPFQVWPDRSRHTVHTTRRTTQRRVCALPGVAWSLAGLDTRNVHLSPPRA